jgi:hypothetical protein
MPEKRKPDPDKAPAGGFNPESAVPRKVKERDSVGPMPTADPNSVARPTLRKRVEEAFARLRK